MCHLALCVWICDGMKFDIWVFTPDAIFIDKYNVREGDQNETAIYQTYCISV